MASGSEPSGERIHGNISVEPAYDYATGKQVYLSTPIQLPTPTHTNQRAVAPLYLVLYPAGSQVLATHNLNCMGVPGNCPDHDGAVAGAATAIMPNVYGNNPAAVPGHDHLVGVANTAVISTSRGRSSSSCSRTARRQILTSPRCLSSTGS